MKGHLRFYSSLRETKLDDEWFGGGDGGGQEEK